jgi:hypothetical protein
MDPSLATVYYCYARTISSQGDTFKHVCYIFTKQKAEKGFAYLGSSRYFGADTLETSRRLSKVLSAGPSNVLSSFSIPTKFDKMLAFSLLALTLVVCYIFLLEVNIDLVGLIMW